MTTRTSSGGEQGSLGRKSDAPSSLHPDDQEQDLLAPFVPRLTIDWLVTEPARTYRVVEGSLAFVDISGFTRLTERLARRGKVGAEELSTILNATFSALLAPAYEEGAGLVKWGGDAVLLLFEGPDHAPRAAQSAFRMRALLRDVGRLQTSVGPITLRMSVGIHSGRFHFFLVGDPAQHRELLISGPAASITAGMEAIADAGQIALSEQAAQLLKPACLGASKGNAWLLHRSPNLASLGLPPAKESHGLDLKRVLPGAIREQVLADTSETEHRTIAVGFVQFSGTDALLERSGPAALANALDECIRNVQQAVAHYDVTFFETDINADGGKVMITSGAPRSVEHPEDRMLLASRQILRNAGVLPLRIGINRGNVFSGDFGPRFRRTYSIKGDAINLAARVMGQAAPGQLLATKALVERTTVPVPVERLAPFAVKGKRQPVQAYSVVVDAHVQTHSASSAPQQTQEADATVSRRASQPLIGREAELRTLQDALRSAVSGSGRVVQIAGEPGIGKSRLVDELSGTAHDVRLISAACDEYESTTPYFPLRQLLRQTMGLTEGLESRSAAAELADYVSTVTPQLAPWVPLIALVLDLPFETTEQTASLDAQHTKSRIAETVLALMTASLVEPTMIVVDDVHLMDDASVDVLTRLADQVRRRPWMLIVTRREQSTGFLPGGELVTIRPRPLTDEASRRLAEQLTEDLPLPPHAIESLLGRAGGNPLFLRGLAQAAQAHENINELPDSVDGLVNSQIDQLTPPDRSVLRAAAVLGVAFSHDDLASLLEDQEIGRPPLDRLDGFLTNDGQGQYRFRHALLRDAAYGGLAYSKRRELHGRAGQLIESRSDNTEQVAEILSFHYFHSARHDRAWHFSRLAGDRAREKFANVEAVEFYERAADMAAKHRTATESEHAQVLEALGDTRFVIGLSADADLTYKEARSHSRDDPLRDAILLMKQARAAKVLGYFSKALSRLTRGLHLLDATHASLKEQAAIDAIDSARSQLASEYALCRTIQGRFGDAITWGLRGADLAHRCHDDLALARAYVVLQDVYVWSGEQPERPYGQLAMDIYQSRGNFYAASHCRNGLAVEAMFAGQWPTALEMYREARVGFERAGASSDAANCEYNEADLLLRQGHVLEAKELLRRVRRVARSVDDAELEAFATRELGRATARAGDVDDGLTLCRQARDSFAQLGIQHEVVDADLAEAECLLLRADVPTALGLIDRAQDQAVALGAATLIPTVHRVRGFAYMSAGLLTSALEEFAAVVKMSEPPAPQHEVGFALAGTAEARRRISGSAPDQPVDADADQTLATFGIVSLPAGGSVPLAD